MLLARAN